MTSKPSKTILITGGSRGIGRAVGLLAGLKGWSVSVNYRSGAAEAEETAQSIRASGGRAHVVQGDVSNEEDVVRLFAETNDVFGTIDAVVVNAGIVGPSLTLAEMTGPRLRNMIDTNVLGALFCAREAARIMPRPDTEPSGSIVFVSSAAARLGSPFEYVDYAASKGALDTLTIGLSKELAEKNIRVNAVRPGLIETDIHASGGQPDRAQRLGRQVPMRRPGTANEVAEAILWLCSDAASYTTGAIIDVAGGR
ncbi:SDR family oxidoreductase [Parasulfitobacter algicola]|uniref:SDR family oxidoreductase n=1 Tax=Parasulfitobacter algicola TaxID=2614809 RepID=A0ABX2IWH4_9RHOB|nr:SDR family oxidoreductase [Sulfitobacter algicola]NSX54681.1 SDR family oxidoreductase [Sulfitobacter algicola]